jgi:hypothetical protein
VVLVGYTVAFGPDLGTLIGGLEHLNLHVVGAQPVALAPSPPTATPPTNR